MWFGVPITLSPMVNCTIPAVMRISITHLPLHPIPPVASIVPVVFSVQSILYPTGMTYRSRYQIVPITSHCTLPNRYVSNYLGRYSCSYHEMPSHQFKQKLDTTSVLLFTLLYYCLYSITPDQMCESLMFMLKTYW
jgi:hypothetical protein